MKQLLTLLAATAFAMNAQAQPTLTFATNAPVIGTQYTLHYDGEYVDPGNAGAMQTWDLTGLSTDSIDVLELVAPSSTTNGDQFPDATVAELSSPVTTYYQVTPEGISFAGSDDGSSLIVNAPLPKYLAFPCTMGSSWSAPHAAEFTYDDNVVFRSGTVSGVVDGYGTAIMPWGTVQNVLRIHLQNVMQDSLALFTMDYTYDSYLYYVPGQSYPLAELVTATLDLGFGNPTVTQFCRWTGELSTDTEAPAFTKNDLNAYPNPTSDVVNIVLSAAKATAPSLTVLDAAGRAVHQERLLVTSSCTAQVDLRELVPGIYTLVVQNGDGSRATTQVARH
jgi:hypothetical protein